MYEAGLRLASVRPAGEQGVLYTARRKEKEHVLIQQVAPCPVWRGSINAYPGPECRGSGEVGREATSMAICMCITIGSPPP